MTSVTCGYSSAMVIEPGGNLEPVSSTTPKDAAFAFGSSTCLIADNIVNTSSGVPIVQQFTFGEIVNSVFLFLTLAAVFSIAFHIFFRPIKIKN